MKIGVRKPSIKRSISARTTGKLKRTVNKAVNPLYGQKGMGYINNPKKAVYNKVYNKTTVGVGDILHTPQQRTSTTQDTYSHYSTQPNNQNSDATIDVSKYPNPASSYKGTGNFLLIVAWILGVAGIFIMPVGLVFIGIAFLFGSVGKKYKKIAKAKSNQLPPVVLQTKHYQPQDSFERRKPESACNDSVVKTDNSKYPPVTIDTVLVYNGTPKIQYEISQTHIGDALVFEQDEEDRYLVSTKDSYDIGYLHKRISDRIDALSNDGYEIAEGHILEITQGTDKLNVKVHIQLEYKG